MQTPRVASVGASGSELSFGDMAAKSTPRPLRIYLGDLTHDTVGLATEFFPLNIGFVAAYCLQQHPAAVDVRLFKYIPDLERALAGGKSILWVARQFGHNNPEHTLRRYTHLLPQEEVDLSFAESSVLKRPYTAPALSDDRANKNTPGLTGRGRSQILERETGIEPATLSLGSC